jgi:hypothetical protein
VCARESNRRHDVGDATAPDDGRGPLVDHAVPDSAGAVVVRVIAEDQVVLNQGTQLIDCVPVEDCGLTIESCFLDTGQQSTLCFC